MTYFSVNPEARNPLYPGAMSLSEARAGAQFITLNTHRGSFTLTALASPWRAEIVPIVSSFFDLPLVPIMRLLANDTNGGVVDLCEEGIHPPIEAEEPWNPGRISVLVERDSILTFYPWVVKEGFTRAANELEENFSEFFVDPITFWSQLTQH